MRLGKVKKIVWVLSLIGVGPVVWADTPCSLNGQQGYCTPAVATPWFPDEATYLAGQIANIKSAGGTLTITSQSGWIDTSGPGLLDTSRYQIYSGETMFPGWTAPGSYQSQLNQTREFHCPFGDGNYTILPPDAPLGAQCFHNNPSSSQFMSITPDLKPTIPGSSRVVSKKVLTRDNLTLTVTKGSNVPVAGVTVTVQSDRTADTVYQPSSPTNASGVTLARVESRDQSSASHITSTSSGTQTLAPGLVNWLPAHYENNFLITCYVISNESDFLNTSLINNVPGLQASQKFRAGFISDVRLQGSGQSTGGTIIHYDGKGRYSAQSCARTATGACAQDGTTIAVDPSIIPLHGTVAIASVGRRAALDTGGGIIGNHIDIYYGTRRADCRAAGRQNSGVDFVNY